METPDALSASAQIGFDAPTNPPTRRSATRLEHRMAAQDTLIERLAALFDPRFDEIKRQLDTLITRREHDKDMAQLQADLTALQADVYRVKAWQDDKPRSWPSTDQFARIEQDVRELQKRPEKTETTVRNWLTIALTIVGTIVVITGCVVGPVVSAIVSYLFSVLTNGK